MTERKTGVNNEEDIAVIISQKGIKDFQKSRNCQTIPSDSNVQDDPGRIRYPNVQYED